MLLSTQKTKFLLDENVRTELLYFLRDEGYDATLVHKGATDRKMAVLSVIEERVLITNDHDFSQYAASDIYAVIWFRTPQNDARTLINAFAAFLNENPVFGGAITILGVNKWEQVNLD